MDDIVIIPIFFDTETTGLSPQKDRIVEIAAFNAHTQQHWVQLVNPQMPIPQEASRVHGISDTSVAQAPTFEEILPQWLAFCGGEKGASYALIAHNNIAFDAPFLKSEMARVNQMPPNDWIFLDTLFWARHYRPDLPRHSLQYLRQIYGIAANQAHRALDDVITLKEVFERMVDDLPWEWVCERLLALQAPVS